MSFENILHKGRRTVPSHGDILRFNKIACELYMERNGALLQFEAHCGCADDYLRYEASSCPKNQAELIAATSGTTCILLMETDYCTSYQLVHKNESFETSTRQDGDFMEMGSSLF